MVEEPRSEWWKDITEEEKQVILKLRQKHKEERESIEKALDDDDFDTAIKLAEEAGWIAKDER